MANLQEIFGAGFDSTQVEPASDFDAIPPGKYPSLIEKTELKFTKKGDGRYVEVVMVILEGEYKNRKLWSRFNIDNPSIKATEIAAGQFSALCRAAGLGKIDDTDELLQKVVVPHVKVKDGQNEIRTYSSMAKYQEELAKQSPAAQQAPSAAASPHSPSVQSAQQTPAATGGKAPWER